MGSKVEENKPSGEAIRPTVPAEGAASAARGKQSRGYSLARRLAFLLSVALGLAGAVEMQAKLGTYAVSGAGAAQVNVPPDTVALSLALCVGVALLLRWRDVLRWRLRRQRRISVAPPGRAAGELGSGRRGRALRRSAALAANAGRTRRGSSGDTARAGAARSLPRPSRLPGGDTLPRSTMKMQTRQSSPSLQKLQRRGPKRRRLASVSRVSATQIVAKKLAALRDWRVPGVRRAWRGWLRALILLLALIASLIADLGAQTLAGRPLAQWWWIASVLLLVAAGFSAYLKKRTPAKARRRASQKTGSTTNQEKTLLKAASAGRSIWQAIVDPLLLTILLGAALLLRLPGLTDQPYVVHGDEASCGLEAYRWLSGGVPSLLSVGWYGLPVLGYGYPALVMRLVGANLFGLRLSSVIIGVLCIALLYALAREFVGRRVAFVAAALMTVAHIAIHFSRMGIHYIHAPFVVLLTLWMLVRALRKNSALAAVMAGIGLSLAMQVYFSARIIFAIVPLFLVGLLLLHRRLLRGRLLVLGWLALSLLVSFGPLGVYFLQDTDALETRSSEVLILNMTPGMSAHLISQFGTADLPTVLLRQLVAVPLLVGGLADQSLQYGPLYAMFDALAAALITIGFFYAVFHLRRPLCLLLVIWVVCTVLLGGVLTIDMPWWPRLLVMVPALCLLAALALEELLRAAERAWRGLEWVVVPASPGLRWRAATLGTLLALAVIVYSGGQSIQNYFTTYPRQVNGDAGRAQYTDIGRYLAQLPAGTQIVLFSDDSLVWGYATFQFLAPQVQGQQVDSVIKLQAALARRAGPVLVIITPSQADAFYTLLNTSGALPPGQYFVQPGAQGQLAFYIYRVGG